MNVGVQRLLTPALFFFVAISTHSDAAITAPALSLDHAEATRGESGVLLRLEGSFPQADLVQESRPLQVLVRETTVGAGFVRFDLPGVAYEGAEPALVDGLTPEGVAAILEQTTPSSGARLLLLDRGRVDLLLPAGFPSGPAEAHIFMIYRGDTLLSNPLRFDVEQAQP